MSNVVTISSDDDKRLEMASRWILKIDEGMSCAEDKAALGAWLEEDKENYDVLMEVATVWDKANTLERLADIFPYEVSRKTEPLPFRIYWSWWAGASVAACLLVVVTATVFMSTQLNEAPVENSISPIRTAVYETGTGERKTVWLPDGSQVILNTNSILTLAYSNSARLLHLERGEILVTVAKEERPLSVVAADQIVQATGTEFSVEITQEKSVEVLVTEGRVIVGIQPKSFTLPEGADNNSSYLEPPPVLLARADNTLSAGEEMLLSQSDTIKQDLTAKDIEVKLSWKEDHLIFRSEPLENALREIERYTSVEFVIMDEALKSIALSGRFKTGDVETLLELLTIHFDLRYEFTGEDRVVLNSLIKNKAGVHGNSLKDRH